MFQPLLANQGLVLIAGEDAYQHRFSAGHRFCQPISRLIETHRDVIELKTVELVLQLADFLAICSHLSVVVA